MHKPKREVTFGQAVVEFALVIPIFLLLVLGVIEFARLMLIFSTVTSASREAARYGAAVGISSAGVPYYKDCGGMMAAAERVGTLANLDSIQVWYDGRDGPTDLNLIANCPPAVDIRLGDRVVVQVIHHYQPLVPLVQIPALPIQSITRRTIVKDVILSD